MLIDAIKNKSAELGLQAVGFAPAIDEVRAVYAWAESVIVAAVSYLPPENQIDDNLPRGRIARFAQSNDYHTVLKSKLAELSKVLEKQPGRFEICVDTCPLPERKLAVLAGIAWRGKNGNVFVEGCGSYVSIGEIITDIKLPVSETPEIGRCGECSLCIEACPVGAIAASGVIDAEKCLSRVTQSSGVIEEKICRLLGKRIYGCDTCQEVCPQNYGLAPVNREFAEEMFPGACPEIIPLIELSSENFKKNVRQSSIGWIRRARIRRNAAIAAGNMKCKEAIPALENMLRNQNIVLRIHAARALARIGSHESISCLKNVLKMETDEDTIKEIEACLSKINKTEDLI